MDLSGSVPRAVLRPTSREELSEALRVAARDRLRLIPWGGGTALPREGAAGGDYDLAIDLTALNRVIEYNPEDFTVTAECGVTISTLRSLLAARGQEAPLEAAHADRATLGGVLAANASGPRRLRFGSPRDRVLGARFALADGTLARSGGKVVKNVAGYGIHRLLCGSRGGLALIVEASLKLAPAPERRLALIYDASHQQVSDPTRWERFLRLEPAVLSVIGKAAAAGVPIPTPGSGFAVVVGLEDDSAWVERQAALTIEALGPPAARIEGSAAAALWQALADLEGQEGLRLSFTTSKNTPAAIAPFQGGACADRLVLHAPAGRLHLFPAAAEAQAMVRRAAAAGFTLIDSGGAADLEPIIAPQAAIAPLRARIREALDPGRQLALGDRWVRGYYPEAPIPTGA